MAWVRLQESAMTHPKILDLPDGAFRLWVWGLCYCQTHLTDGAIPVKALPAGRRKQAEQLIEARLWEGLAEDGYGVHDYLQWNDTRDVVLKKRQGSRTRAEKSRERAPHVAERTSRDHLSRTVPVRERYGSSSALVEEEIGMRAGNLVERYGELFMEHRSGAKYRARPNLDWLEACDLCRIWPNERLEKLAALVLTTDDPFIAGSDRSFKIFALKASWADGKLCEWERKQA